MKILTHLALLPLFFASLAWSQALPIDRTSAVRVSSFSDEGGVTIRSCGSGTLVYRDAEFDYYLSNAHVTGVETGSVIELEYFGEGGIAKQVNGELIYAAFVQGIDVDIGFVRTADQIDGLTARPISCALPAKEIHYAGGHPSCFSTLFTHIHWEVREGVLTYRPAAISGQSGSGNISFDDSQVVGLTTWTDNTHGYSQNGEAIRRIVRQGNLGRISNIIPAHCRPACENPRQCRNVVAAASPDVIPLGVFACEAGLAPPLVAPPAIPSTDFEVRVRRGGVGDGEWAPASDILNAITAP